MSLLHYLNIELILAGVAAHQVVSSPFHCLPKVVHLASLVVSTSMVNTSPSQNSQGESHGVVELDKVSSCLILNGSLLCVYLFITGK